MSQNECISSLSALLVESLAAWRIEGSVEVDPEKGDAIRVRANGVAIEVRRAPQDVPFRWLVSMMGRQRMVPSVSGVLRLVRKALDAEYVPFSARIAPLPEVPV